MDLAFAMDDENSHMEVLQTLRCALQVVSVPL